MALITPDDFIGDINLPQRDATDTPGRAALQLYIYENEPDFMRQLLGVNFYEVFKDDIAQTRMIELRDGKTYQVDSEYFYWPGLIEVIEGGKRISPIAIWIYLQWMRNKVTRTGKTGETKIASDNATQISPIQKMVQVENKMVKIIRKMHHFLDNNTTTYPEWDKEAIKPYLLVTNNEFGF